MSIDKNILQLCVNTIRTLSIDAIQKANSGHPGLPMGAAPMAAVLWLNHLKHSPHNPEWPNRDRFVLSGGHGSMLLYSLLHLTGYRLSLDEIKNFRQWGSLTPGHPEFGVTPGVEATTGPLGQGAANAVGMAIAERRLAALFNRKDFSIVDHFTYALVTDGDLMEGVSAEAASLAGHLKLGKLIYLYDANDITLDGPTELAFSRENVGKRFESYGWHVQTVQDGDHDFEGLDQAIESAKSDDRPSLIIVKTTIGYGSPNLSGTSKVHGAPLGPEEIKQTKKALKFPENQDFFVPEEALSVFRSCVDRGRSLETKWTEKFTEYQKHYPDLAEGWAQALSRQLPEKWDSQLPEWQVGEDEPTRKSSGRVLNEIAKKIPWFIGGDADLSCSTGTLIQDGGDFDGATGMGSNIHYGVREHAMGAIANGMLYHSGLRPFVATFFCFLDYMKPAVRLAAMNRLPAIYVWTHDSVFIGEDGPTHQPVEHLASLRCIPNMVTLRPADPNETREAWRFALCRTDGPTGIILTRQKVKVLDRRVLTPASGLHRGAYLLKPQDSPQVVLISSGSEIEITLSICESLTQKGIAASVVSMPSWEIFSKQDASYQNSVLPRNIPKVAIEAGSSLGWERWVGDSGLILGLDRFGASANLDALRNGLGFSPEQLSKEVQDFLSN